MAGGRFAIVIFAEGSPSAAPSWIPESEARIIISQIKDFDPVNQPLAFDELRQLAREKQEQKGQWTGSSEESPSKHTQSGAPESLAKPWDHWALWIGIAVLLVSIGIWFLIKRQPS